MLDQFGDDGDVDSDNKLANDKKTDDVPAIPIQELKELEVDNLDVTPALGCESMILYSFYVRYFTKCIIAT